VDGWLRLDVPLLVSRAAPREYCSATGGVRSPGTRCREQQIPIEPGSGLPGYDDAMKKSHYLEYIDIENGSCLRVRWGATSGWCGAPDISTNWEVC